MYFHKMHLTTKSQVATNLPQRRVSWS